MRRTAEAFALSLEGPESRERVLRWAWDKPDEVRDPVTTFWKEDRYFHFRPPKPKPEELPAHWTKDNGPWARRHRKG